LRFEIGLCFTALNQLFTLAHPGNTEVSVGKYPYKRVDKGRSCLQLKRVALVRSSHI